MEAQPRAKMFGDMEQHIRLGGGGRLGAQSLEIYGLNCSLDKAEQLLTDQLRDTARKADRW